ncbi:hypothetical protein E2974_15940 [Paracoccus yeei]|uniref:hypothetical protein n=1 Tax=Paracoccus yeei TaxID=147645 RepID=UPI0037D27967
MTVDLEKIKASLSPAARGMISDRILAIEKISTRAIQFAEKAKMRARKTAELELEFRRVSGHRLKSADIARMFK